MIIVWESTYNGADTTGQPYITTLALETSPATVTITASIDPLDLTTTSISIIDYGFVGITMPSQINISVVDSTLTISTPDWGGLWDFLVKAINPLTKVITEYPNTFTISATDKVFYYLKDPNGELIVDFFVTVEGDTLETETKIFQLQLVADYSGNITPFLQSLANGENL